MSPSTPSAMRAAAPALAMSVLLAAAPTAAGANPGEGGAGGLVIAFLDHVFQDHGVTQPGEVDVGVHPEVDLGPDGLSADVLLTIEEPPCEGNALSFPVRVDRFDYDAGTWGVMAGGIYREVNVPCPGDAREQPAPDADAAAQTAASVIDERMDVITASPEHFENLASDAAEAYALAKGAAWDYTVHSGLGNFPGYANFLLSKAGQSLPEEEAYRAALNAAHQAVPDQFPELGGSGNANPWKFPIHIQARVEFGLAGSANSWVKICRGSMADCDLHEGARVTPPAPDAFTVVYHLLSLVGPAPAAPDAPAPSGSTAASTPADAGDGATAGGAAPEAHVDGGDVAGGTATITLLPGAPGAPPAPGTSTGEAAVAGAGNTAAVGATNAAFWTPGGGGVGAHYDGTASVGTTLARVTGAASDATVGDDPRTHADGITGLPVAHFESPAGSHVQNGGQEEPSTNGNDGGEERGGNGSPASSEATTRAALAGEMQLPLVGPLLAWAAGILLGSGLLAHVLARINRKRPEKILAHPLRGRILRHVEENPGAHKQQIAEALDVHPTTVDYHLRWLAQASVVRHVKKGRSRLYFAQGAACAEEAIAASRMRIPTVERLVDLLRERPGMSRREAARALGVEPSLVRYHAKHLTRAGILKEVEEAGAIRLFIPEERQIESSTL